MNAARSQADRGVSVFAAVVMMITLLSICGARAQQYPPAIQAQVDAVERARENGLQNADTRAERALIEADLAFASDARARGVATAFAERMHPSGKLIAPGSPIANGPESVRNALAGDAAEWRWAPIEARADGMLGVTWGISAIVFRNASGELDSVQTRYVTVWRRHHGEWRIWLDIGNRGPPPDDAERP